MGISPLLAVHRVPNRSLGIDKRSNMDAQNRDNSHGSSLIESSTRNTLPTPQGQRHPVSKPAKLRAAEKAASRPGAAVLLEATLPSPLHPRDQLGGSDAEYLAEAKQDFERR
jgi:hypothetical protein